MKQSKFLFLSAACIFVSGCPLDDSQQSSSTDTPVSSEPSKSDVNPSAPSNERASDAGTSGFQLAPFLFEVEGVGTFQGFTTLQTDLVEIHLTYPDGLQERLVHLKRAPDGWSEAFCNQARGADAGAANHFAPTPIELVIVPAVAHAREVEAAAIDAARAAGARGSSFRIVNPLRLTGASLRLDVTRDAICAPNSEARSQWLETKLKENLSSVLSLGVFAVELTTPDLLCDLQAQKAILSIDVMGTDGQQDYSWLVSSMGIQGMP